MRASLRLGDRTVATIFPLTMLQSLAACLHRQGGMYTVEESLGLQAGEGPHSSKRFVRMRKGGPAPSNNVTYRPSGQTEKNQLEAGWWLRRRTHQGGGGDQ